MYYVHVEQDDWHFHPDDVVPIIAGLGIPFSAWVADQLHHHAPTDGESLAMAKRMDRSGMAGSVLLHSTAIGLREF